MAIAEFLEDMGITNNDQIKSNVVCKDGTEYLGVDMISEMRAEGMIGFYLNDKYGKCITEVPVADVRHISHYKEG